VLTKAPRADNFPDRSRRGELTGPIKLGNPGDFTIRQLLELDWKPTAPLEQGPEPTITWFNNLLEKSAQQP
jgi:hypothetical protein